MKLEKQRKECEMEELQRAKEFERAKAEAEALENAENEEMPAFPTLDEKPPSIEYKDQRVKDYLSTVVCNSSMDMTIPPNYDLKETILPPPKQSFREGQVFKQSTDHAREQSCQYSCEELPLNYHSTPCKQEDITQIIVQSMQAARMPPPNLTIFSGNPIEWPTWKTSFENIIERRAVSSSEKILYLLQYLSGPPRKIV